MDIELNFNGSDLIYVTDNQKVCVQSLHKDILTLFK